MKYLLILLWLFPSKIACEQLSYLNNELGWLAANIYFEARNQGEIGMKIVRDVTLNRVQNGKYGIGPIGVITKRKQFSWTHQQSWDSIQKRIRGATSDLNTKDVLALQQSYKIASDGLYGASRAIPEGVLYYHTTAVNPSWNKGLKPYGTYGLHVLYYGK